ncbi:MAG TPA: hypothetical protein VN380_21540 [Thermoanaerobaculia bacterium]|nr:hypothetical protein [Thermoanaerobaculia bacterium]
MSRRPRTRSNVASPPLVLDLVPLVQGGTTVAALRNAAELARAVDRLGYTRLFTPIAPQHAGDRHHNP